MSAADQAQPIGDPELPPALRAADTLVELFDLQPGSDMRAVAEAFADLDERPVPFPVDALLIGLRGRPALPRPLIVLNSSRMDGHATTADARRRRRRFTLGHEIGHLHMSWHVGNRMCAGEPDTVSGRQSEHEQQAYAYARRLLVPRRWLDTEVVGLDVPDMFKALSKADAHWLVLVLGLIRALPSGYVLAEHLRTITTAYMSPHTRVHQPSTSSPLDVRALDAMAEEAGTNVLGDRRTRWWRVPTALKLPDVTGLDSRELLQRIADDLGLAGPHRVSAIASVNAIAGMAKQKLLAQGGVTPETLLAALTQRAAGNRGAQVLSQHPDWPMWMAVKAQELAS